MIIGHQPFFLISISLFTKKFQHTMSKTNLFAAFATGAAAGAILGLLFAPASGEETRKKILKSKHQPADQLDQFIEEGKKTWYETKGKVEMGAGIAADELDDFVRHIMEKGETWWSKTKSKASELADDAQDALDEAVKNGKKTAQSVVNEGRNTANEMKARLS
jgi:gas vesicle protein